VRKEWTLLLSLSSTIIIEIPGAAAKSAHQFIDSQSVNRSEVAASKHGCGWNGWACRGMPTWSLVVITHAQCSASCVVSRRSSNRMNEPNKVTLQGPLPFSPKDRAPKSTATTTSGCLPSSTSTTTAILLAQLTLHFPYFLFA
jgi:hypothetical protein